MKLVLATGIRKPMFSRVLRMGVTMAAASAVAALFGLAGVQVAKAETAAEIAAMVKSFSTAAPAGVVEYATIAVLEKDGKIRVVRKGTNNFTCLSIPAGPLCADENAMEWFGAVMGKKEPPKKSGLVYMLAGDEGSNTDPWATGPTADNHWVKTGPHVMVVGDTAITRAGYARTPEADPTKPYVMWPGTPYEHLMIPVK
jgi:hypothetical protein